MLGFFTTVSSGKGVSLLQFNSFLISARGGSSSDTEHTLTSQSSVGDSHASSSSSWLK